MNESNLGKSGRHGGRPSPHAGIRDMPFDWAKPDDGIGEDIDPEKVWALYNRPGTPGEKSAAKEALKRMGAWQEPAESRTEPKRDKPTGPKRFRVTLRYEVNGKVLYFGPHEVEADDSIEAESKVRKMAKAHWAQTVGGRAPDFHASSTQRV
jgi:hypothetical protein